MRLRPFSNGQSCETINHVTSPLDLLLAKWRQRRRRSWGRFGWWESVLEGGAHHSTGHPNTISYLLGVHVVKMKPLMDVAPLDIRRRARDMLTQSLSTVYFCPDHVLQRIQTRKHTKQRNGCVTLFFLFVLCLVFMPPKNEVGPVQSHLLDKLEGLMRVLFTWTFALGGIGSPF